MSTETSRPPAVELPPRSGQSSAAPVPPRGLTLLRTPIVVTLFVLVGVFWGWYDVAARTDPATGRLVRQDDWQVYRAAGIALREGTPL
ncbi:MAG: hypothetical protein JSU68_07905, partial [Phycisphaerales bacterium]